MEYIDGGGPLEWCQDFFNDIGMDIKGGVNEDDIVFYSKMGGAIAGAFLGPIGAGAGFAIGGAIGDKYNSMRRETMGEFAPQVCPVTGAKNYYSADK